MSNLPDILTPQQVADYLQMPLDRVVSGLESGELPGIKVLGEWRIFPYQLQELFGIPQNQSYSQKNRDRGVVIFYHQPHGYGFIKAEEGNNIHFKAIDVKDWKTTLKVGSIVEFEIGNNPKGLIAQKIEVVSSHTQHPPKKAVSHKSFESTKYYNKALQEKELKNLDKARELFEKAISYGDDFEPFVAYASMEDKSRHSDKAIQILEIGINLFPDIGLLYEIYGTILDKNGEVTHSVQILKEGLQKTIPRYRKSLNWALARVLMKINNDDSLEEAIKYAEEAKKLGMSLDKDDMYWKLKVLSMPVIRKTINYFRTARFDISKKIVRRPDYPDYIDLFVRSENPEYTESYALSGWMLARCFFKNKKVIQQDIDQMVDTLRYPPYKDFNISDTGFLILNDLASCVGILEGYKEKIGEVIIPIDRISFDLSTEEHITSSLRQILDQWLARRDLFDFKFPVAGRRFFGRSQEILNLMGYIEDGHYVGVYGLRKVGKTSLLYQIKEKRSNDFVVHIDLQEDIVVKDCNYLYWKIAYELQMILNQKSSQLSILDDIALKLGSIKKYSDLPHPEENNPLYFDEDINYLLKTFREYEITKETKIIIIIDELEVMLPIRDRGFRGYIDFFRYLRGISQRTQGKIVNVIAAANPTISEQPRWEGIDNPMFHFYKEMFLPFLEKNDCCKMLEELGKRMGISFEEKTLDYIYIETGGHPFIARQLCSHITKDQTRPLLVTEQLVLQNIDSFIITYTKFFGEILERLDNYFPLERDILLLIAKGISKEHELIVHLKQPIDVELRHLIGYQIVDRQNDEYKIKINLLHRWIRVFHLGGGLKG